MGGLLSRSRWGALTLLTFSFLVPLSFTPFYVVYRLSHLSPFIFHPHTPQPPTPTTLIAPPSAVWAVVGTPAAALWVARAGPGEGVTMGEIRSSIRREMIVGMKVRGG